MVRFLPHKMDAEYESRDQTVERERVQCQSLNLELPCQIFVVFDPILNKIHHSNLKNKCMKDA